MFANFKKSLLKLIDEVRGNALWDFVKWAFASSGLLAVIASFFAWLRRAPLGVFIGIAASATGLAFSFVLFGFLRNHRSRGRSTLVVRLDSKSDDLKKTRCRIEIENKRETQLQNVKAQLISIDPKPRRLQSMSFPVSLHAQNGGVAINPHAKGFFDLFEIEIEPAQRRISLSDELGNIQSFEAGMYDMLGEGKHGYLLDIRISALDLPESKVLCKLRLEARPEDAIGLAPFGGYCCEITSDEEEALEIQNFMSRISRRSVRI